MLSASEPNQLGSDSKIRREQIFFSPLSFLVSFSSAHLIFSETRQSNLISSVKVSPSPLPHLSAPLTRKQATTFHHDLSQMALLLEKSYNGQRAYTKLRQVVNSDSTAFGSESSLSVFFQPLSPRLTSPSNQLDSPIYVLDESDQESESGGSIVLALSDAEKDTRRVDKVKPAGRRVVMPPECIYEILKRTQDGVPYDPSSRAVSFQGSFLFQLRNSLAHCCALKQATLKNASLVCKLWTDPARRM